MAQMPAALRYAEVRRSPAAERLPQALTQAMAAKSFVVAERWPVERKPGLMVLQWVQPELSLQELAESVEQLARAVLEQRPAACQ
jgi:hypothetical protein